MKQSKIKTLVLASNNQGKLKEFDNLFDYFNIEIKPQSYWQIEDAVEDGLSFIENAIIKARHASSIANLPAIADDSGLEVFALNGEPGIYSARYAGTDTNDMKNVAHLLDKMAAFDEMRRGARYYCALAMVRHKDDPTPVIAEGSWYGEIGFHAKGSNGFGYDPIFNIPEMNCSVAELENKQKAKLSHRAQASEILLAKLKNLQLI